MLYNILFSALALATSVHLPTTEPTEIVLADASLGSSATMIEKHRVLRAPRPYPSISAIDLEMSEPKIQLEAGRVTIEAQVANRTSGELLTRFYNQLWVNGQSAGLNDCDGLSAGNVCQAVWQLELLPGSHALRMCADAGDLIDESQEGDNCRTFAVEVP